MPSCLITQASRKPCHISFRLTIKSIHNTANPTLPASDTLIVSTYLPTSHKSQTNRSQYPRTPILPCPHEAGRRFTAPPSSYPTHDPCPKPPFSAQPGQNRPTAKCPAVP